MVRFVVPQLLLTLACRHTLQLTSFTPASGQYALTAGSDRQVVLWNAYKRVVGAGAYRVTAFPVDSQCVVNCIAVRPDSGAVAGGGTNRAVTVWDVSTGSVLRSIKGHSGAVHAAAWAPTGQMLWSAAQDKALRAWDMRSRDWRPCMEETFRDAVTCVEVAGGGDRVAAGSVDETVRLFDIRAGSLVEVAVGDPVTHVQVGSDGDSLFVWTQGHTAPKHKAPAWQDDGKPPAEVPVTAVHPGAVRFVDLSSGQQLGVYRGHTATQYPIRGAVVAGDAGVVSGDEGGNLVLWDVERGGGVHGVCERLEIGGLLKGRAGAGGAAASKAAVIPAAVPHPRYRSHGDRCAVLLPSHAGVAALVGDAEEAKRVVDVEVVL